jgi:hypothetical protein
LGTVRGNLVYFPRFGILYQEKSGSPAWRVLYFYFPALFFLASFLAPENSREM